MDPVEALSHESIPFLFGLQESGRGGESSASDRIDDADGRSQQHGGDEENLLAPPYIPFTYRFLGLRLRLAFTKRRFQRVEASYQAHISSRRRRSISSEEARAMLAGLDGELDSSFKTLRNEIDRIEEAQESMRVRALPKVESLLVLHECYQTFLFGFIPKPSTSCRPACALPFLNVGTETTAAIKKLIADFAGVPVGAMVHDLQSLVVLLQKETITDSEVFRRRRKSESTIEEVPHRS